MQKPEKGIFEFLLVLILFFGKKIFESEFKNVYEIPKFSLKQVFP